MALRSILSTRIAQVNAMINDAGLGCKLKYYTLTRPTVLGGPLTTQQLLATLTFPTGLATVNGTTGVATLNSPTQNNLQHVSGTPTWVAITKSDDTVVDDLLIPSDMAFAGSIVNGVDISLINCTITPGNA